MRNISRAILRILLTMVIAAGTIACEKEETYPNTTPFEQTPHMDVRLSYVGGKLVNVRTGTECLTYRIEDEQAGCIRFDITNVSGTLDIKVCRVDSLDFPEFEQNDIKSSNFHVDLHTKGEYIVWITARSFAGKYDIQWSPIS